MRKYLGLGIVVVGLAFVSCGGGGGSGGGACAQVGNAICAKACSCRDGAECAIGENGSYETFPSENDCRGSYAV